MLITKEQNLLLIKLLTENFIINTTHVNNRLLTVKFKKKFNILKL